MNETATHSLTCQDRPLPRGVRKERNWTCSCGQRFYGYDASVKREHKAHAEAAR